MHRIEKRLRLASLLIAAGLAVQVVSLLVKHPLAFVGFLAVGCPLVGIGSLLFLLSVVSSNPTEL